MAIKYYVQACMLIILLLFLSACHSKESPLVPSKNKTIKTQLQENTSMLYYSGVVEPIKAYTIKNISAEGVVTAKYFDYGRRIEKDQVLFLITSEQLAKDYKSALMTYLKAKKSLDDVTYQVQGQKELNKLNIVSKQEYMTSQTQLFNAQLDYDVALQALAGMMKIANIHKNRLMQLKGSLTDKQINEALLNVPNRAKIISPYAGIALYPQSSGGSASGSSSEIDVGSRVKPDDTLVSVHDKSGIAVTIKVNEIDILKINYKRKVTITSDAFPGITLNGVIEHIDREAISNSYGGSQLPSFNVRVVVAELTPDQYTVIRMGMTCEVAIEITSPPMIKVPITAVIIKDAASFVKRVDPKTKKMTDIQVKTGSTDMDSVEILEGLAPGEEVLIDATSH